MYYSFHSTHPWRVISSYPPFISYHFISHHYLGGCLVTTCTLSAYSSPPTTLKWPFPQSFTSPLQISNNHWFFHLHQRNPEECVCGNFTDLSHLRLSLIHFPLNEHMKTTLSVARTQWICHHHRQRRPKNSILI